MWILLALLSALCLGFYDIFKKASVRDNNVLAVLFLNTVFQTLLMSPVIIIGLVHGHIGLGGTVAGHMMIVVKALIVLGSWVLGYFAIKHLPLTIQGPINATRPVVVLVGALLIFGERLNWIQWIGILLGFASLYFISRLGAKEGISLKHSRWIWMSIGAMVLGAISALYDKYLLNYCAYDPSEVQAWYSLYQCVIMGVIVAALTGIEGRPGPVDQAMAGSEGRPRPVRPEGVTPMAGSEGRPRPVRKPNLFSRIGLDVEWRWSIPCISLFLTIADLAYFYCLSYPDAMISIVSMIRRGSVIVSFLYGVLILHEKNVRAKTVDLCVLLLSLALLVIGAL